VYSSVLKNSVCRLLKKTQKRGARKVDASAFAQDGLGGGVLTSTLERGD
jgi:hypothetical protein